MKFHFFKEQVERGKLELTCYSINEQIAILFTKPLKFDKLKGKEKCLVFYACKIELEEGKKSKKVAL